MATISFPSKIAVTYKEKEAIFSWKRRAIFQGQCSFVIFLDLLGCVKILVANSLGGAIFQGAIIIGGNYLGCNLPGGTYMGDNSPGGNFPGGNSCATPRKAYNHTSTHRNTTLLFLSKTRKDAAKFS